jgi:fibronectin-binding autotransporter adhesin
MLSSIRAYLALGLLITSALHAADINTTGGATITGPINFGANDTVSNITGSGTLTLNGSGLIGLANNGGGRTVNMSMTGGLIDIGSGVRLQNGGWQSGNWTNNFASVNIASGGTLDVWDGNDVRIDALTGAGLVDITRGVGIENFGPGWAGTRGFIVGVNNGGGTFTGTIAGSTALGDGGNLNFNKNGSGTQILTGTNTYAGTTTISGGTLQIGNGGSTGTIGTGNITNNAALVFNRSGTSTVAGSISGSGSLTTNGTGTFILAANNSYSGATTINTGSTLQIGNGGGTGSLGTASTVTNNGTLAFNLTGHRPSDKVISGSGNVSYAGGGAFEPTVDHSYTGTTTITSSQVIASGDARLGTAPATPTVSIIMDGGSIFNGNFATTLHANRTIQLNAGGGQFRAGYGQNFTINSKLTGIGSLSVNWDGAPLILANAANDYAGDTVIGIVGAGAYTPGGAQLRMGVTNALPYGAGKGNLVLNTNADTPGATSNLDLNGFNTQVNGLNGTSAGRIYSGSAATLTVGNNNQNGNFAGVIYSNASLAKVGSGTQILSGGNSYSGTTTISAGTLQIGDGGTTGALGAGNVANDATLTFNRSNDYAVSNTMSGSGNVIKNGAGTITFTNAKNYNGTTTVNAGVLELNAGGPGGTLAGSGPIIINNGGTVRANTTDALGYNNYSATNGITINEGGTLTTGNGYRYSNDRSITSIGGTITSSGTGFNSGASYTMRSWNGASYNFTSAASGTPSTISATDFGLQGDVNFNVTDGPGAVDLNVTGNIVNVFGQGNLIKSGAGVMVLAADNTYTGPTTISGGTLQVGAGGSTGSLGAGAITNNGALVFNRSGTYTLNVGLSGTGSLTTAGTVTLVVANNTSYSGPTTIGTGSTLQVGTGGDASLGTTSSITNNGTLIYNQNGSRNLSQPISGSGNVSYTGGATFDVTTAHTYTGTTTLAGGSTMILGADNRIGSAPATPTVSLIMDNAQIFNGDNVVSLSANRTVQLNSGGGQFRIGYGKSFTINGKVTGTGGLSLNWDGAPLILANAANDYAGDTTIGIVGLSAHAPGNALLRMGAASALPSGPGTGNLVFGVNTTNTGALAILDLNGFSTETGALTGSSNARIDSQSGAAATLTVGGNNGSGTFEGLVQGNLSLVKEGTGTQILAAFNTYTGTTTVNGGTLQLNNGSGAGTISSSGPITINNGGTLVGNAVDATGFFNNGATNGITINEGGTLSVTENNRISMDRNVTVTGGTIASTGATFNNGASYTMRDGQGAIYTFTSASSGTPATISAKDLGINNTATFTVNDGPGAVDLNVTGNLVDNFGTGAPVKAGAGTMVLNAASSYSGTTTVTAGTLEVKANDALGTTAAGTSVQSGGTLRLNNVNYSSAEALSLNGSGTSGSGALRNVGNSTYAGPITAATNATINAGGGTLTTTGGLVKNGTTLTIAGGGKVIVNGTGISGSAANSDLIVDATTLVVNAASNYNGPTTVQNAGTLVANAAVTTTKMTVNANSTLSGTSSITTAGGGTDYVMLNGTLQVGDSTLLSPTASALEFKSSGPTGSTVLTTGSSSSLYFDLLQRGGDLTGNAAAADTIRLFGTLDATLGGTLFLTDSIAGAHTFAAGDQWKIFDLSSGGSITGSLSVNYLSLNLDPSLVGTFNSSTGTFSITSAIPEPSRAMLFMLGLTSLLTRRRRRTA